MIKFIIKFLALSLLIFVCGCATLQPNSKSANQMISWQTRSAELKRIQSWTAHGSVSIQHADKTDIASLQWHQQNDHYQFALFGPLGFGRIEITGEPGAITLNRSNKPPISAATPELLMQSQLGWYIPISNLYCWVRSLPASGVAAKKTFDAYHHLAKLQQQGWTIEYLEYMSVNQVDLPRKIQLSTDKLKIKLVIREWAIEG